MTHPARPALALVAAILLAGCSTSASTSVATSPAPAVLPVPKDPIVNTATAATLAVTYAAAENNVDPATGKTIADRLELTLKNTGAAPLSGLEVYYTMTDATTGKKEGYYQKLTGLTLPAGQSSTVYFDGKQGAGHYPENTFSIYRSSTNQVDFRIEVSAPGAKIAVATATKSPGTGEKVD